MKVLIACEFSGIVRDAFIAKGHDAVSCDLLPTERPGPHYQGNVIDVLYNNLYLTTDWDMMIAHPPCTHLSSSGAAHFAAKRADGRQQRGIDFFLSLTKTDIPKVCIENPMGIMSTHYRKPNQVIQPYEYGHDASKGTCLWLKGLSPLIPTEIIPPHHHVPSKRTGKSLPRWSNQCPSGADNLSPGPDRGKLRSTTYQGIADAMADQWG